MKIKVYKWADALPLNTARDITSHFSRKIILQNKGFPYTVELTFSHISQKSSSSFALEDWKSINYNQKVKFFGLRTFHFLGRKGAMLLKWLQHAHVSTWTARRSISFRVRSLKNWIERWISWERRWLFLPEVEWEMVETTDQPEAKSHFGEIVGVVTSGKRHLISLNKFYHYKNKWDLRYSRSSQNW